MNSTSFASSVSHSASGKYYENGCYYSASGGTVEMVVREDGLVRYFQHYIANMGNMVQEITREQYFKMLGDIVAIDGKPHATYGCTMKVYVTIERNVRTFNSGWEKVEAEAAKLSPRDREREAVARLY